MGMFYATRIIFPEGCTGSQYYYHSSNWISIPLRGQEHWHLQMANTQHIHSSLTSFTRPISAPLKLFYMKGQIY